MIVGERASNSLFDPFCRKCPRLVAFLKDVKKSHPDYHAKPVAAFGDSKASLLIVGLAPGMHGANASGRPFTGDYAGILLYETLFEFGFSSHSKSASINDGLTLSRCRITNAVKCLPPKNKPLGVEINNCNGFLAAELMSLPSQTVILALGRLAHESILRAFRLKQSDFQFRHAAVYNLPESKTLVDCYHCSRYNIQTKRLTSEMFRDIFKLIMNLLDGR